MSAIKENYERLNMLIKAKHVVLSDLYSVTIYSDIVQLQGHWSEEKEARYKEFFDLQESNDGWTRGKKFNVSMTLTN